MSSQYLHRRTSLFAKPNKFWLFRQSISEISYASLTSIFPTTFHKKRKCFRRFFPYYKQILINAQSIKRLKVPWIPSNTTRGVPLKAIYSFVLKAVRLTFPVDIWGNGENFNIVWYWIKIYIQLHMHESIRIHDIVQKIKLKKIQWLSGGNHFTPLSASRQQTEVFKEFVFWFFSKFVIALLRSAFYITDTQQYRKAILYFPHPVWQQFCKLDPACFRIITHTQLSPTYSLNRFLPKGQGARVLFKQSGSEAFLMDIKCVFKIFKQILLESPHLLGGGVLYMDKAHESFEKFFLGIQSNFPNQPLYGIKIDVKRAFDSILIKKLLQLLPSCFTQSAYEVHQKERLRDEPFSRDYILQLLGFLFSSTCFNFKNNLYHQFRGIPQGCSLSPLLCSFYYGQMERKYFHFLKQPESLFIRYVDDFLFLSVSKPDLRKVVDLFLGDELKLEFGLQVNLEKSIIQSDSPTRVIPWCGLLVDLKKLLITNDFSNYEDCGINCSFALANFKHCRTLKRKWKRYFKSKYRKELFDLNINPCPIILKNIFELTYFTALKSVSYLKRLHQRRIFPKVEIILGAIKGVFFQFYRSTLLHFPTLGSMHLGFYAVKKPSIYWLVLEAYDQVFSRHLDAAEEVLTKLKGMKKNVRMSFLDRIIAYRFFRTYKSPLRRLSL